MEEERAVLKCERVNGFSRFTKIFSTRLLKFAVPNSTKLHSVDLASVFPIHYGGGLVEGIFS
jgi:urease accessory protein UreH